MRYVGICSVVILSLLLPRNAGAQQLLSYDIGAQPVEQALNTFAFQNNMSLIFPSREAARGLMSREVRGRLTREAALKQMLEGTGLHYEFSTESAAVFVRAESAGALSGPELDQEVDLTDEGASSRATASGEPWAASGAERSGMPQVLIQTKRTLNIDTERSRDGVQPHIVFDRDAIQKSGDKSVSEFLKRRLTMGVANSATAQEKLAVAGAGELDLHGFGSNQTLVLIDGRRLPGSAAGGPAVQPDLDGIPLSAVERIEVLPTAASGIYGGGATGGVINIVLRRDYVGTEARLQYENPFDDAAGDRQVHVSHGFRLQEGRAHVLLRGTYSRQETLSDRDRPFLEQGRRQILANNPDYFAQSASVPLGALTNIRSANRQPLFGPGTPSFTHVPPGYESSMGAAALAGNAGTYNWGLASTAQAGGGGAYALLNEESRRSGDATLYKELTNDGLFYVHAAASRHRSESLRNVWEYGNALNTLVAASAPNNPFGQDIVVSVPMVGGDGAFISTLDIGQLSAGANFALWGGWKLGADATAGQSKLKLSGPESRDLADSVYTGAMDVLRDTTAHPFDVSEFWQDWKTSPFRTATREMTLLLGGPLAPLPAGPLTLTASVQRREERYTGGEEWRNDGPGTPFNQIITRGKQSLFVTSAYSELRAPLIPRELARAGLHGLELQLAVRFDSYTTDVALAHAESEDRGEDDYARADFSSWNGVAGLRYQPTPGMTFRASYSTGFLPPRVSDLVPPRERQFEAGAFVDERRGGEPTADVLILAGGNPLLRPERSASTSVGFLLKPANVPNFRLSIDGVRIVKTDNIYVVGELAFDNLLRYEEMFPERVTREAVAAGDSYGFGRIRTIDATNINAARMEVVSVDVDLRYAKDVPHLGLLEVASMGTWVADFKMQPTPLAPLREYVGTTAERPLEFRATLGLSVTKGRWGYGWDVRYFGPYKVSDEQQIVSNQGTLKVSHQVFHDTYVSWQTEGLEGLPKAVELRLGVRNVFDVRPRFDAGAAGNSYYSRVGDPRLAAYYLAVTAGF